MVAGATGEGGAKLATRRKNGWFGFGTTRIQVGDFVQKDFGREDMWVLVTNVTPTAYIGTLANIPVHKGKLKYGSRVRVAKKEVMAVKQNPRKQNGWFGFGKSKAIAAPARKLKKETFHGYTIKETESGDWVVPELDRESVFDSKLEVQRFVRQWAGVRKSRGRRGTKVNNPGKLIPAKVLVDEHGRTRVFVTASQIRRLQQHA